MSSLPSPLQKNCIFGRRKGRPLRKTKTALLSDLFPSLEFQLTSDEKFPLLLFKDKKPLWIEIGYGTGDHLISQMKEHPHCNFIGCEPFLGGIASFLEKLSSSNLPHEKIRLFTQDARLLLKSLDTNSVEKIFILFPDPWPKKKHHKRRFFQQETLLEIIRTLIPGGSLVLASDHENYYENMESLVLQNKSLILQKQGVLPNSKEPGLRPFAWPMSRFEFKAHQAQRQCRYIILQKSSSSPINKR
ncbi:MAG: tRNA (guanosine(46)-N7)-methyltransferase TrmB [Proteobacteria bacterium]|nr:tRNA (guanosine(46)-N7)-methyltransferase TrmB [Pseudomonadota bacterium]